MLRTRARLFRNVTLAVIGLALAVAFLLPPRYSTSAAVMLEPRRNNVADQTAVLSDTPTDPASIENQIQLITSRDLAARVVDKLGLARDPEFGGGTGLSFDPRSWLAPSDVRGDAGRREDLVVTTFLKHLSAESVGLSTTIAITVSSRDPEKAALIANTVAETYLEMQEAVRFDVTERTTAWLADRIRLLAQQVQLAEANVQRYKAENGLNESESGLPLIDQQLSGINAQLVTARADLAAKEANNDRIAALMHAGHAADISQIVASPLIVQLREQQAEAIRQEAALNAQYGPRHPKIVAAEEQKRDLEAKIAQEVSRIAGGVENDVAVARAQVRSLEDSLQQAESQAADENMTRVKLKSLEANAVSTRSMYEAFVARLRETQGQDTLQIPDARVISHAPVPASPSFPPRLPMVLASVPVGLLLGFLAVLLAERGYAASPVVRPSQMPVVQPAVPAPDPYRGVPVLAALSGAHYPGAADFVVERPSSSFALALRDIVQRIAQPARGVRPKIVALTSVSPREGKTAVSLGLARAASQAGLRVILLEGNLQTPEAAWAAGLPAAKAGLLEVLRGSAKLSQALQRDPRSGVLVLSLAGRNADPSKLWASAQMQQLVNHLRQACDLVVIDAAPLSTATELPQIVRRADALIVVANAPDETPRPVVTAALDHLRATAGLPSGIILTR